jgi:hypothetical protein
LENGTVENIWAKKAKFMARTKLFSTELLVQLRYVVIPLGLIQVASYRVSQVVLLSKFADGELATVITRAVGQTGLIKSKLSRLLVNQKDVSV